MRFITAAQLRGGSLCVGGVQDVEGAPQSALPSHQQFSSANGGEYRKTYHGFAPGYALVVDSPTAFQIATRRSSW